jgi:ribosomal-protein-alanine N-acetyltransferase
MATEDLTSVLTIERSSFLNPWGMDALVGEMMNQRAVRLVGRLSEVGQVVGFALGCLAGPELHVNKVATHPSQRREGFGRRLVEDLLRRGSALGASEAWLEMRCSNRAAAELYRLLGFREAGIRVGYYSGDGEDALVMTRAL